MIEELLQESKESGKLISLWNYNAGEGFWCGYVKDYNDEFAILQLVSKYGKLDGVLIEKLSAFESIDFDDEYAKCMQYIVDNNKALELQVEIEPEITLNENWQSDILEDYVGDENIIVRITVADDNNYSGIVRWLNAEEVLLNIVGNIGEDKGKTILKLDDISRIRINDIDNRKKLMLFKWRKAGM